MFKFMRFCLKSVLIICVVMGVGYYLVEDNYDEIIDSIFSDENKDYIIDQVSTAVESEFKDSLLTKLNNMVSVDKDILDNEELIESIKNKINDEVIDSVDYKSIIKKLQEYEFKN